VKDTDFEVSYYTCMKLVPETKCKGASLLCGKVTNCIVQCPPLYCRCSFVCLCQY